MALVSGKWQIIPFFFMLYDKLWAISGKLCSLSFSEAQKMGKRRWTANATKVMNLFLPPWWLFSSWNRGHSSLNQCCLLFHSWQGSQCGASRNVPNYSVSQSVRNNTKGFFFSCCFGYCHKIVAMNNWHEYMMFLPQILAYKKSSTNTILLTHLLGNSSSPFPFFGWTNWGSHVVFKHNSFLHCTFWPSSDG